MPDEMTTTDAGRALGTSAETIRTLIRDGVLTGRQNDRGWWLVDRRSVDAFLREHGPLNGGRRRNTGKAALRETGARSGSQFKQGDLASAVTTTEEASAIRERDTLRARVVVLEDSVAGMRDAADLQRQADAERSEVVKQLLAAVASSERADSLRGQAIEKLEDALARATMPGYLPNNS